ncbi:MAG TPA: hypothetical protein VHL81_06160 [Gemmatimonadales bacterium]|jgi:uncharacterized small protein (DUF1192 family)|nr:hypothetical protein [Gemmatimonadales bacterium]
MTTQADDTPETSGRADDEHGERLAVLEQLESGLERPMQVMAPLDRGMRSLSARTAEGRALCFLLAVYALAELAGRQSIEALRREIAALRAELRPRETP